MVGGDFLFIYIKEGERSFLGTLLGTLTVNFDFVKRKKSPILKKIGDTVGDSKNGKKR